MGSPCEGSGKETRADLKSRQHCPRSTAQIPRSFHEDLALLSLPTLHSLPCSLQHSSGGDCALLPILAAICANTLQLPSALPQKPFIICHHVFTCVCHPWQAESLKVGLCSSLASLAYCAPASVLSGVSLSLCAFCGFH